MTMKPIPPAMPVDAGPTKGLAVPAMNMRGAAEHPLSAPWANTAGRQLFARRVSQLNRELNATHRQHIARMPRMGQPG